MSKKTFKNIMLKAEHIIFARKGESIPEEALFIGFDTFHFG